MLQKILRDFTRRREDMNFMLERQEQHVSNDLFVLFCFFFVFFFNKATNRLNRTLFVSYSLAGILTNQSHATEDICWPGFSSSLIFDPWIEYESTQTG